MGVEKMFFELRKDCFRAFLHITMKNKDYSLPQCFSLFTRHRFHFTGSPES